MDKHKEAVKWGVQRRLEYLENHLCWRGHINRKTIMDETGVSKAQASLDLALYKKQVPDNLVYSLSDKTYNAGKDFKPLYIDINPDSFLKSQQPDLAEQVTFPFRNVRVEHLRTIHNAIENCTLITVDYLSLSDKPNTTRTIAAHHYVSDGYRWHIRAYDFSIEEFRDFVLGRITNVAKVAVAESHKTHKWEQEHDKDWTEEIELILTPHSGLTENQRTAIEADYCMEEGQALLKVRKANLFYITARMQLLEESPNPVIQQVVLINKDEIKKIMGVS